MAATSLVCSALRITVRGGVPVPTIGSFYGFSSLSLPSKTSWSVFVAAPSISLLQCRHGSFFNKLTAEELWRGVLAETGAGARKGRGKRTKRKMKKDLNRGQSIGEGRGGFLWPGLNAPVVKSGTIQAITKREQAAQDELRAEIIRQRDEWDRRKRMKVKRERGWTGNSWGGISLGAPDPGPNGETYEDFDSRVIEVKSVFNMTAKEGFALGKAADRNTALRKAKNRAIHYLFYIERYNHHTIYHDITSTFKRTTIRMKKQNRGYGLHCHRAVITICKLIGIEDMYAKVSGSTNLLNITRALFQALAKQETHQDLSEKKQLNVVEFQNVCGPLPFVVASPHKGAREQPEKEDEIPDTRLDWGDVKAAQGMKRSIWANVKRTIW
ncbi:small ribosomal subunit protein uS5m isoform X3 [Amia ocellicauda]|uniref:small ribosomal subunit protein uS5m isoform X3 n=1 Tax=Amia ocellicauda TaxID=2972642 RepID=UPI003464D803